MVEGFHSLAFAMLPHVKVQDPSQATTGGTFVSLVMYFRRLPHSWASRIAANSGLAC